ncbi:MAG TPA: 3'-5' exonuclease, partial [Limnochordia bacterium]|nr:3'-5' exonuclease [Limnochordia bacterium]
QLFDEHPDVLERYRARFTHILVDEYQDTNAMQYRLIRQLADRDRNICVVGDDWQAIYGFRHADMSNILQFERDYTGARVVRLEQNYRSTRTIIQAANAVIRNNENQLYKELWTHNPSGEKIQLVEAPTDFDEANFIGEEALFLRRRYDLSDMAVLFRTGAQSRLIEEACLKLQIPYRLVGGYRFYDRSEVRDAIAYLRLIDNPDDAVSLQRVINTPKRGIGAKALAQLAGYADRAEISVFRALSAEHETGLKGQVKAQAAAFHDAVIGFHELKGAGGTADLLKAVLERFGYRAQFDPKEKKDLSRLENLDELVRVAEEFDRRGGEGRLKAFLDYLALLSDLDTDSTRDQITLMSVHAAKGLEFPVVFIIGLEENLLPHYRALDEIGGLEEERRLFYVAMTRAKQLLYLTYATERGHFGARKSNPPSPFLAEIPAECIKRLQP